MSDELQNGKIKNLNIYILLCLIFIISLYLFEVIIPFAVAFIIAYLVNPLKVLLDKYLNETVSSLFAVILFIICLLSLLILISPIIIKQTQNLLSILPSYMSKIEILIDQYSNQYSINKKINNKNGRGAQLYGKQLYGTKVNGVSDFWAPNFFVFFGFSNFVLKQ